MTMKKRMLIVVLSFFLPLANAYGGTEDLSEKWRAIDAVSEKNCSLKILIPIAVDSVDCGTRLHSDGYTILSISYFLRQFLHKDFDRSIEGIIRKTSLENYLAKGASGQLIPLGHETVEASSLQLIPLLSQASMQELCGARRRTGQARGIAANNWTGYLWTVGSRLKHADLAGQCMASDVSEVCFIAIIGNNSRVLHFSPICLPRNGKKTYPNEFDFDDFMKMIYSIRFDTD